MQKLKIYLRRIQFQLFITYRYYFNFDRRKQYFFILGEARTGSSLLGSYIESIPDVSFGGELLNPYNITGLPKNIRSKKIILNHLAKSLNALPGLVAGAKLHYNHLHSRKTTILDLLNFFPDAKFLIIYRQSITKQYVSFLLAKKTGRWFTKVSTDRLAKEIKIEKNSLEEFAQKMITEYSNALNHPWKRGQCCIVTYEELADNAQEIFSNTILPFLGLSECDVQTSLIKQISQPLSELVINYDEVSDIMKQWDNITLKELKSKSGLK